MYPGRERERFAPVLVYLVASRTPVKLSPSLLRKREANNKSPRKRERKVNGSETEPYAFYDEYFFYIFFFNVLSTIVK
jgi:hypothetical protein